MCVCVRVCVCACVRACVRACVCVCVCMYLINLNSCNYKLLFIVCFFKDNMLVLVHVFALKNVFLIYV